MTGWSRRVGFALAFMLAGTLLRPAGAASPSFQSLPATEIVLAIDQSGSMVESDPRNERIEAARRLVETVSAYADSVAVRVGAVTFGSPRFPPAPRVLRPLTAATQPGLRDAFVRETLQGTDFDSTLCLAWTAVTLQRPGAEAGCPANLAYDAALNASPAANVRNRVVVLVTDGFPAPAGDDLAFAANETPAGCPAGSAGHAYMCVLQQRWAALNRQAPVDLFVVGIDRSNRWFPTAAPYWRAVTGCVGDTACAVSVRVATDPATLARDILNASVGGTIDLCSKRGAANDCDLPASLAEVQFLIEGIRTGENPRVFNPAGQELFSGGPVSITTEGSTQRWRVKAPPSGRWLVQSTNTTAELTVSRVLVPQQFVLKPVPAPPTAGLNVSLDVTPNGALVVDLPSLQREQLELRLQRDGQAETRQPAMLRFTGPTTFVIDNALPFVAQGSWLATLVLPGFDPPLQLGKVAFQVGPPAATPTPSPTATPTPAPTAMPSPTPSPTPTPPPCSVTMQPPGGTVTAYRLGFKPGYPLRFHTEQRVEARVEGGGCAAAGPVRARLSLSSPDPPSPCPPDAPCSFENSGVESVTVGGNLPGALAGQRFLHRAVSSMQGDAWVVRAEDDVELVEPALRRAERLSLIGYWLPLALLLLLLLGLSIASTTSRAPMATNRYQTASSFRRTSVSIGNTGLAKPLVRGGVAVWRPFVGRSGRRGILGLKYLVAGPLTVRGMKPAGAPRAGPAPKGALAQAQRRLKDLGAAVFGSTADVSEANLIQTPPRVKR